MDDEGPYRLLLSILSRFRAVRVRFLRFCIWFLQESLLSKVTPRNDASEQIGRILLVQLVS